MNSRIKILQGDITQLDVDAIVNAANSSLMGGGGVDGAIHRAAGPQLKEACRLLRGCATGDAKITEGFDLKARHVIHTVGPVWNNGTQNEEDLLASAYRRSLEVAAENQVRTIAFPSISTGAYRFPFEKATTIALREITKFLDTNDLPEAVTLVAFSKSDHDRMTSILNNH
ncbi:MAG: O-acetyl-ADP-ribose deacetylase [Tunicatimonas sp.]